MNHRAQVVFSATFGWLIAWSVAISPGTLSSSARGATPIGPGPSRGGPTTDSFQPAATNSPPTISSITNQVIAEDTSAGPLGFTVADAETPATNLTVIVVSSNLTLVPATNLVLGGLGGSRTLRVIPAANQTGVAPIKVTVSDGSLSASTSFSLTVTNVNDLPVITFIPDQTLLQGSATVPLPFLVGDVETAASALILTVTSTNKTLVANTNILLDGSGSSRTIQIFPQPTTNGTTLISLSVFDTDGGAASTIFRVTVTPTNAPSILLQPHNVSVTMNTEVAIDVLAAGAPPLSYQWLHSGVPVPGATNSILLLSQARPVQGGDYQVVVSNPFGVLTSDVATVTVALVRRGSVWNYRDTGEDLGTDWRWPAYDDSAWLSNRAEFGYGDGDEVTVVKYGTNAANKYITTYFRVRFPVDALGLYTNLLLRLLRDDGAVVYLNGVEAYRSNLPAGEVTFGTLALTDIDGAAEQTFLEAALHPALLVQGWNVLAVEVHQGSPSSPDLSFDLELIASGNDPPQITTQPRSQTVAVGSTNLMLKVVPAAPGPFRYVWQLNGLDIPGATNATLLIPTVLPENAGSYRVIVINAAGAVVSETAAVSVNVPVATGADAYQARTLLVGNTGLLRGDSSGATQEPGEPTHGSRAGGRSVWYTWTANASGIASFDTRGSGFDTLLAVYTGSTLSNLTLVAADEDRGGYYTSAVQFNAEANRTYSIAVDGVGFGGAGGAYLLHWSLVPTNARVPVIVQGPASQGVQAHGTAVFTVAVEGGQTVAYQWYFNGRILPGQVGSVLILTNVGSQDVGRYSVRLDNNQTPPVFSAPALLQVGSHDGLFVFDKLEDLFPDGTVSLPGPGLRSASVAGFMEAANFTLPPASGTIGLQFGSAQYINTPPGSNNVTDPLPGLQWGPGTVWVALTTQDALPIEIDTAGSTNLTGGEALVRIAVYDAVTLLTYVTDPTHRQPLPVPLAYDSGDGPGHQPCHVMMQAPANSVLAVQLSPVGCVSGDGCVAQVQRINVRSRPKAYFGRSSSSTEMGLRFPTHAPLPGGTAITYLRRNGAVLSLNPSGSSYRTLANCASAGTYDLLVSNSVAQVLLPFAMLFVDEDVHAYSEAITANGRRFVRVTAFSEFPLQLQRSAGLPSMEPGATWDQTGSLNADRDRPLVFFEPVRDASIEPPFPAQRFLFWAAPWTVPGTACQRCGTPVSAPCASPIYPGD